MKCSKISRNCVVTNKKLRGNYLFSSQFLILVNLFVAVRFSLFQNFLIGVHLNGELFLYQSFSFDYKALLN